MFASFDPVALDMACAEAVNAQPVLSNSMLGDCSEEERACHNHDHFHSISLKPVGKQLFLMEKKSELETVNINLLQ